VSIETVVGPIAVVGHRGLVGGAVLRAAGSRGRQVEIGRVRSGCTDDPAAAADCWIRENAVVFESLCHELKGSASVVNAAGLAAPRSNSAASLFASNVVLPVVVARAAHEAGVSRFVHVSSAAVQGGARVLDETWQLRPLSAYATSKADGELALRELNERIAPEVVVFRAVSVLDAARSSTQRLVQLYGLPTAPVFGSGSQSMPVTTLGATAVAVVECCTATSLAGVLLHPSHGVTAQSLAESLRAERTRLARVPSGPATLGFLRWASRRPAIAGFIRLVELLAVGQDQQGGEAVRSALVGQEVLEEFRCMASGLRQRNGKRTPLRSPRR